MFGLYDVSELQIWKFNFSQARTRWCRCSYLVYCATSHFPENGSIGRFKKRSSDKFFEWWGWKEDINCYSSICTNKKANNMMKQTIKNGPRRCQLAIGSFQYRRSGLLLSWRYGCRYVCLVYARSYPCQLHCSITAGKKLFVWSWPLSVMNVTLIRPYVDTCLGRRRLKHNITLECIVCKTTYSKSDCCETRDWWRSRYRIQVPR